MKRTDANNKKGPIKKGTEKEPLNTKTEDDDDKEDSIPSLTEGSDGDSDGHTPQEGDADFNPTAVVEDEAVEIPEEVSFDDLTDDEREMLGLEAKPKQSTGDDETENSGMSWQEFGYEEEELQ